MLMRTRLPAAPFAALSRDMDRLFESMFSSTARSMPAEPHARWFSAPLNIWEDEDSLHVETELPGVKLGDLEILASGEELTIKGARESELPDGGRWLRRERGAGTFERKTALPSEIDVDKIQASLRDGVLHITLPKAEAMRPRRIAVKALTGGE